jgi:hypothetical protein
MRSPKTTQLATRTLTARGGEFADLRAAWNWAEADARAMVREGQLGGPPEECWVEICDTTGTTVASLPFVRLFN